MDGRPTWTDFDEAGDYVVPNVLSPRDLVFRPDNMDETVPHCVYTLLLRAEIGLLWSLHGGGGIQTCNLSLWSATLYH